MVFKVVTFFHFQTFLIVHLVGATLLLPPYVLFPNELIQAQQLLFT